MHWIDIIVICLLLYYFYKGWKKGFIRSFFGAVFVVIGWIGATVYYYETKKLVESLIICIAGPIVLNFLLSSAVNLWISPHASSYSI